MNQQTWWELHLRKARGETLSDADECAYHEELARQEEQAPPLTIDLAALKQLHEEFLTLSRDNHEVRTRIAELESEIHRIEKQLSREIRQAIGITE
jgi:hypothetical protein